MLKINCNKKSILTVIKANLLLAIRFKPLSFSCKVLANCLLSDCFMSSTKVGNNIVTIRCKLSIINSLIIRECNTKIIIFCNYLYLNRRKLKIRAHILDSSRKALSFHNSSLMLLRSILKSQS